MGDAIDLLDDCHLVNNISLRQLFSHKILILTSIVNSRRTFCCIVSVFAKGGGGY